MLLFSYAYARKSPLSISTSPKRASFAKRLYPTAPHKPRSQGYVVAQGGAAWLPSQVQIEALDFKLGHYPALLFYIGDVHSVGLQTGTFGRTVTVKLRYADFRTLTRSRTGAEPIAGRAALAGAALGLVRGVFPLEKRVRLLGVAVSGFGAGGREDGHQIAFDFGQQG